MGTIPAGLAAYQAAHKKGGTAPAKSAPAKSGKGAPWAKGGDSPFGAPDAEDKKELARKKKKHSSKKPDDKEVLAQREALVAALKKGKK